MDVLYLNMHNYENNVDQRRKDFKKWTVHIRQVIRLCIKGFEENKELEIDQVKCIKNFN